MKKGKGKRRHKPNSVTQALSLPIFKPRTVKMKTRYNRKKKDKSDE